MRSPVKRSDDVEGTRRVRRHGIDHPATQQDDRRDDRSLEDERGPPTDSRRDETSDQGSCRRADAS
jgi:hypothetical protein